MPLTAPGAKPRRSEEPGERHAGNTSGCDREDRIHHVGEHAGRKDRTLGDDAPRRWLPTRRPDGGRHAETESARAVVQYAVMRALEVTQSGTRSEKRRESHVSHSRRPWL
jgi:hypothetical protein